MYQSVTRNLAEVTPAVSNAADVTPDRIMQLGFGCWASKTLLSAIELGVFTELAAAPRDGEALRQRLGLHPRAARDFFADGPHPFTLTHTGQIGETR